MDPNSLRDVDDQHFNRVWQILKETYESERHFNELESKYRLLASQWLLAAFAGIGLIMTSDPKLDFDKLWLVVGICFVSCVGIWQLWRMDLMIYHRLLSACFLIGIEMEGKYPFLPEIKTRMRDSVDQRDVTRVLFYYYFFGIAVLSMIGFGMMVYLQTECTCPWILIGCEFVVMIAMLAGLLFSMKSNSRERMVAGTTSSAP